MKTHKSSLVAVMLMIINVPVAATADDCITLTKNSQLIEAERAEALHELERVNALKPLPDSDAALCRAALRVVKDAPYFVIASEAKCFQDEKQAEAYKAKMEKLGLIFAKVASAACTDEEKRRGVKSKVLDGEP